MTSTVSKGPGIAAQLRAAVDHQSAGRIADAERLYREVLALEPLQPDANHNLAVLLARRGELALAAQHLKLALEQRPNEPRYWTSYFECLLAMGELAHAASLIEKSKNHGLAPGLLRQMQARLGSGDSLETQYRTAVKMHQDGGQGPQVEAVYRKIIAQAPNIADVHSNLGSLLRDRGALDEAVVEFRRALELRPDFPTAQYNLGNALKEKGDHDGAAAAYRAAVEQNPNFVQAHNNLGNVLKKIGKLDEAEAAYARALEVAPEFAEAHFNLGNIREEKGALDDAEASYRQALRLMSDYAEVHNHLGVVLSQKGKTFEAFESFTRSAVLTYGPNASNRPRSPATQSKARHDREQRGFISRGQSMDDASLTEVLRLDGGERISGPAVNPANDVAAIAGRWQSAQPQLVVIDDLLTAEALDKLRRLCWGSTFWRNSFDAGYLGATPQTGFACPLLAQIGEEMRAIYPDIFGDHPLLHAWAFKYESGKAGTGMHADFAAVNVNFWITPDEANLDPQSGGLVVYDKAAPLDWDFADYNLNQSVIRDFLIRSEAKPQTVPYRSNRAVIFDSDLFHETDRIAFRDGYINRRINVTLLYGWRQSGKRA